MGTVRENKMKKEIVTLKLDETPQGVQLTVKKPDGATQTYQLQEGDTSLPLALLRWYLQPVSALRPAPDEGK